MRSVRVFYVCFLLFSFLFSSILLLFLLLLVLLFVEDHRWVIDMLSVLRISYIFMLFSLPHSHSRSLQRSLIQVMLLDSAVAAAAALRYSNTHGLPPSCSSALLFFLPFIIIIFISSILIPFSFYCMHIAYRSVFLLASSIASLCLFHLPSNEFTIFIFIHIEKDENKNN